MESGGLVKRIIPCLDIKDGRTVKGTNFVNLRDAGDPVELAALYAEQGADELVFLDISASNEKRKTLTALVERIAQRINIPFTVGGGVREASDARRLLMAGADKIAVNTAAVLRPELISELAAEIGKQSVVLAIDGQLVEQEWRVFTHGGSKSTTKNLFEWAATGEQLGAGEILFTSMHADGTKNGFELQALQQMARGVNIPIIASGGAGKSVHFLDVFNQANADAALAASVFHFKEISLPDLKTYLKSHNIAVR